MHAACSSNGNGSRHDPDTSPTRDRLGAAFAEPAVSPESGAGGRDAQGRFAPGNAGGPGNPFARRVAELRRAFLAEATGEDLRAVCRALLARAQGGDVAAAQLALSYLLGKPERAVDPDTLDEHEWQIHRRSTAPGEWVELIQTLPLDVVLPLVRAVWPVLAREKVARAEPLFTQPAPQEPEREAAGGKSRSRRRGGTRRRAEAMESSPEPEEGATPAGEAAVAGEHPSASEEPSVPACVPLTDGGMTTGAAGVPRPGGAGGQLLAGPGAAADAGPRGKQPGEVREERTGTETRTGASGKGRRRGAEARPARGGVRDGRGDSGVGGTPNDESGDDRRDGGPLGGRRHPSTNRGDGATPGAEAPVHKRSNRQVPAAEHSAGGPDPDVPGGKRA